MKSICLAAVLAAALSLSAQGGKCNDPGLIFTISSTYTDPSTGTGNNAGLLPDNQGPYINGTSGVKAVINTCNGSDGATLSPGTSGRTVWLNLVNKVDTTRTPSWTSNPAPVLFFTIPNITYLSATVPGPFTTYMKVTMAAPNSGYYFDMENSDAMAPFNPPSPNINAPCFTALVRVQHIPATADGSTKETWIVWPDSSPASCTGGVTGSQVGTLLASGHPNPVSAGQFTVPFYITIQRQ